VAATAADAIRLRILTGRYASGQSLPGERELSEELGVSRLTLRAALSHLEAEGLVRAVHGSGTRVLDFRQTGGLDLFGHIASLVLSGAPVPGGLSLFSSLMELRRAVAIEAVGLAAERASVEGLREMRAHVGPMGPPLGGTPGVWIAQDLPRLALKLLRFGLFVPPRRRNLAAMLRGIRHGLAGKTGPFGT